MTAEAKSCRKKWKIAVSIWHAVKSCVSGFRQSQENWRCKSGAVCRLNPLATPFSRVRDGMRAACGVNAAPGAGNP